MTKEEGSTKTNAVIPTDSSTKATGTPIKAIDTLISTKDSTIVSTPKLSN